ncbi:MAG: GrpB family protein [Lentisphaeria bacterium]|nr:GrpB family protein [Lentisphaeria bacterium]
MNQHPEKVKEYADLKMRLQMRFKHDRDAYTTAKGDFIRQCVKSARNK